MSRNWTMPRSWNRRLVKRGASLRLVGNTRWHALAERRRKLGLTTRGTLPKRKPNMRISYARLERLTNGVLLAKIDALAAAINRHFDSLPHEAKAAGLELELDLAALRREIT